jgi:hypothetical protein
MVLPVRNALQGRRRLGLGQYRMDAAAVHAAVWLTN